MCKKLDFVAADDMTCLLRIHVPPSSLFSAPGMHIAPVSELMQWVCFGAFSKENATDTMNRL
jgi:hypothetical protein